MSRKSHTGKYIFVTGGVVSSVGKGLVSASLATLMESRGFRISIIKCDPYINVDPGTLSPFQHGEVYVTKDGAETDLDLGHYERFTQLVLNRNHSLTAGQVYKTVIEKERKGDYLGRTVQVIPHITDEIKRRIRFAAGKADITVVEIGGTVGDIEGLPFIEAIRQMRIELKTENTLFAHVTFVPFVPSAGELKSKPTQHSVKALREVGLQPDFLICRSNVSIDDSLKSKIALFSNLNGEDIITAKDVESIYEVPLLLAKEGLDEKVVRHFQLKTKAPDISRWKTLVSHLKKPETEVTIGLIGKYVHLRDSYQSLHEALIHGGLANKARVHIKYIDSEKTLNLKGLDGILVPGGFGDRGIQGKLEAICHARENHIPFLGICLGMQAAAIEFARNVCSLKKAHSREFQTAKAGQFVIDVMPGQKNISKKGGSMRLGSYSCDLKIHSKTYKIYRKKRIHERHRHRYEFNSQYAAVFEKHGMNIAGNHQESGGKLAEVLEIPSHPWFIGVQFHPEFQSKTHSPAPSVCELYQGLPQTKRKEAFPFLIPVVLWPPIDVSIEDIVEGETRKITITNYRGEPLFENSTGRSDRNSGEKVREEFDGKCSLYGGV